MRRLDGSALTTHKGGPVIRCHDVQVQLGSRVVLNGVTCAVDRGVTAVVGSNGAGKTTLLRVLAGVLRPTRGVVEGLGVEPYSGSQAHRRYCAAVGWMPQSASLPAAFTVRRLVEHSAWLKGLERREADRAVDRAISVARVTQFADRRLGQMSGGERQRAVLAACLVASPSLLVLDEPTVGLDPGQRDAFQRAVRDIGATSAVVISTHILEDVFGAADRVLGVAAGRIVLDRASDTPALREQIMGLFRQERA